MVQGLVSMSQFFTSPNSWGDFISRYLLWWWKQNPQKGTFSNPCFSWMGEICWNSAEVCYSWLKFHWNPQILKVDIPIEICWNLLKSVEIYWTPKFSSAVLTTWCWNHCCCRPPEDPTRGLCMSCQMTGCCDSLKLSLTFTLDLEVSWTRGTPKSPILTGLFLINHLLRKPAVKLGWSCSVRTKWE